ncbi:MAG: hypothetical protein Q3998_05865 [Porphyromonas sp.]|nr:hypothetical protein [Porphyromonas sp.]
MNRTAQRVQSLLLLVAILFAFSACQKGDEEAQKDLAGKWMATELQMGTKNIAISDSPNIDLKANGTISVSNIDLNEVFPDLSVIKQMSIVPKEWTLNWKVIDGEISLSAGMASAKFSIISSTEEKMELKLTDVSILGDRSAMPEEEVAITLKRLKGN